MERVWDEYGFVPGPGVPPAPDNETRTKKVRRVLGTLYHTTFAAGLCCATMIACQSVPPESDPGVAGNLETPPGKATAWRINWNQSSRQTREVLNRAAESDLLEHPLFMQALEMLERIGAA